jgi:cell wall-associated protease
MFKNSIFILILLILFSCSTGKENNFKKGLNHTLQDENVFWYQKDFKRDSIPGISLEKFLLDDSKKKANKKYIIVATLDTQIDINHEDLKNQLWINKNEIPENGVDDDKNGYIDDVFGWNFLGTKGGHHTSKNNYEYVKIVRENKKAYDNKELDSLQLKEYQRALKAYDYYLSYYSTYLSSLKYVKEVYQLAQDSVNYYYPNNKFKYKELDSIYKVIKKGTRTFNQMKETHAKDFTALVFTLMSSYQLKYNTYDQIDENEKFMDSMVSTNLNINLNERKYIGDDVNVMSKGYGNRFLNIYDRQLNHNTEVSGVIAGNRENKIGVKGFSNQIKIMPICIANTGSEHDKDIANGIYYAVDNGAKIINMSFGKDFSIHKEWVFEAMKYAEGKGVLLVHCSGNDNMDVDINPFYPSDYNYDNGVEICNNFINVGSTTKNLDSTFVSDFSDYGKKNVDLFAPGDEIYVCRKNNTYEYDSGTSLAAPMVTGTAALIWLYYPKLTASEVKQIILDSGTAYDIEVLIPGGKGKKTKFSELSKSGKVLNVYNAMKMAEEMSKKKKIKN